MSFGFIPFFLTFSQSQSVEDEGERLVFIKAPFMMCITRFFVSIPLLLNDPPVRRVSFGRYL